MAMPARRLEIEFHSQLVEKRVGGSLPNSHGAITLHVAVSTNRAEASARLANLPTQQH